MAKKPDSPKSNGNNGPSGAAPSAYFRSLTLKNIRCFGENEQTLNLSDKDGNPAHWTVILGNNGTGKTTLLECLAAFNNQLPRSIIGFWWVVRGREHHLLRAESIDEDGTCELAASLVFGTTLRHPSSRRDHVTETLELHRSASAGHTGPGDHLPYCCCYGASRRMGSTSLGSDQPDSDPTSPLYDDTAELRNAEEWLLQLDYSASKDSEIQSVQEVHREQVRQLLIDILPDVSDIRFTSPTEEKPRPGVEFQTPDGWLPLRYIGLGYRTTMAWMVDFASRLVERYPKSKDPLSEPAVCLVDEIDLHLHPRWQRTLMQHLSERFPNVQFIVTAHSPLFVQAAENASLVVLRREKDRVRIDNDVERIKGWRVDQLLTSDLFELPSARPPHLDALLDKRKKLLTKGKLSPSDRRRLEELSEQIGSLPGGETAEDAKTRALLERALKELKKPESRG